MPEEQEESGFTVRDRRRFVDTSAEASPPAQAPVAPIVESASVPAEVEEEEYDDAEMEEGEESGELPDVYSVLAMFLGELRNLAWIRMGLVANPMTGAVERDLSQARVAIDTVAFLAGQLDSVVSPAERPELKNLVSDLQINFIEQTRRTGNVTP